MKARMMAEAMEDSKPWADRVAEAFRSGQPAGPIPDHEHVLEPAINRCGICYAKYGANGYGAPPDCLRDAFYEDADEAKAALAKRLAFLRQRYGQL